MRVRSSAGSGLLLLALAASGCTVYYDRPQPVGAPVVVAQQPAVVPQPPAVVAPAPAPFYPPGDIYPPKPPLPRELPDVPPPRETVRGVLTGKTVMLSDPGDIRLEQFNLLLRGDVLDYIRQGGGLVIEGGRADYTVEMRVWYDVFPPLWYQVIPTVSYPLLPPGVYEGKVTVDIEIKTLRADGSRQVVFRGRGEAGYDGTYADSALALSVANRRALLNIR